MRAVIFDMDGVIIDSEPLHLKIEREIVEEYGGRLSSKEYEEFVGTSDYHMWSSLKRRYNLKPSVEELIMLKKQRLAENIDKIELVDNFFEFMLKLYKREYLLALASSNNRKIINLVMDKFNLNKYIRISISGEEVLKGKPDPEIFLKAAKKLDVSPDCCLVIEDSHAGVQAAKAAGMKCIGYKNPNSGNQDLSEADLIVKSFSDLSVNSIDELLRC